MYDFDRIIERRGTDSIKWNGLEERFGSGDVLPLWVADMDFPAPEPVVRAIRERADHGVFGYACHTERYNDALIGWLKRRHGWELFRDEISFSPGIVTALVMIVEAFSKPGDQILVQSPVYYPFFDVIRKNGRTVIDSPLFLGGTGRYEIDFKDLEEKLARKETTLMLLCSPHNPVGRVWTREELTRIGELCLAHGVLVAADEIHCDFVYPGHRFIPFMSLGNDLGMNGLSLMAPSKTFNMAGLKSSLVMAKNPDLLKAYNAVLEAHHLEGMNCFGLAGTVAAYEEGDEYVDQLIPYLEGNVTLVRNFLREKMPQIKLIEPEGTYLLWLDCRAVCEDPRGLKEFFLKKARVALSPGAVFGPTASSFMRMNIGCPRSVITEALVRIEGAWKSR
jgi:cysteine-S-conjugate beta-lyase